MNALFFRKCESFEKLKYAYEKIPDFGQVLEYKIIKIIDLKSSDYDLFISNFLVEYSFISSLKNQMHMDEDDCVHCILIRSKKDSGILVYSAGYSYARYVAIFK